MFDTVRKPVPLASPIGTDSTWHNPLEPGYDLVAMVSSAGGIQALREILGGLPANFPLPVLLAQHRSPAHTEMFLSVLRYATKLRVMEARTGEVPDGGVVYVAPAGRHLRVDRGRLCVELTGRIKHVCPSGDLLLQSVASYGPRAIAVVLSGTGRDGALGVTAARRAGSFVIAQDPDTCPFPDMSWAAVETRKVDLVLSLDQIAYALRTLAGASEVALRVPRPRVRAA